MLSTILCLLAVRSGAGGALGSKDARAIAQIGSFEALKKGEYDGAKQIGSLLKHGDFGVGTFQRLNGEMIVVDGTIYQGITSGQTQRPALSTLTPFACVVKFHADTTVRITRPLTMLEVQDLIDKAVGPDRPMAIRIDGQFMDLTYRAFPPQNKPYKPYDQIQDQAVSHKYPAIDGTFVGFRLPKSIEPVNVPGYHFHFVDRGRHLGGHVTGYVVKSGTIRIMRLSHIEIIP